MSNIKEYEDKIVKLEADLKKTKNPATIAKIQSEISSYKIKIRDLKSVPSKKKEAIIQKDNPVVADHTEPALSAAGVNVKTDGTFVATI